MIGVRIDIIVSVISVKTVRGEGINRPFVTGFVPFEK